MAAEPSTAIVALRRDPVPLVVAPFSGWTYKDASDAVSALKPSDFDERKDYAEDKHWREGKGFVGPLPLAADPLVGEKKAKIEAQFAPYDGCGEVLAAVEDAFALEAQLGYDTLEEREPTDIPPELQKLGAEAIAILAFLWDRVRLHEELKPAIRTAAWAERAILRWWIPPGRAMKRVDGDREVAFLPQAADFDTAASWLALSRPSPDMAAVIVDEATQERAAVYLDEVEEGEEKIRRAVVAYREGDKTIWRTLYEDEARDAEVMELTTGGLLPLAEMRGDNLLTPSVIATQKQLDYAESVVTRTVDTAGFPERYISNAEPTGIWVKLATGEVPTGPTREFQGTTYQLRAAARTLGSSITTELVGIITPTEDGSKQTRATPSVERFEPVDPEFAIKVGKHARAKILRMCRQGHRVGDGTGEASGFAYQQDRAAFEKDLGNRKGAAEGMLRDLFTSGLGIIEALTGKTGYFTSKIRVTVDMHVDAGPRSPEERNQDREDVKEGLLSPETAISRGGVEDVGAEVGRIASSPSARLALLKEAAEVFAVIEQASSAEAAVRALIAAGVDPEIANALRPVDTDRTVEP